MDKLTQEEKSMLAYFWKERGNIERYPAFEEIKPKIQAEIPELLTAWDDYRLSVILFDEIINKL